MHLQVTVLGAPAENSIGGTKVEMINKNAFDTVDFCMMLTPMNCNIVYPSNYLLVIGKLVFLWWTNRVRGKTKTRTTGLSNRTLRVHSIHSSRSLQCEKKPETS